MKLSPEKPLTSTDLRDLAEGADGLSHCWRGPKCPAGAYPLASSRLGEGHLVGCC